MKNKILSTLFIGIDVSTTSNVLCALNFQRETLLELEVPNNKPGALKLNNAIIECLTLNGFTNVIIALESTSVYSIHIASYLAANAELMPYKPYVYCLNPKTTANYGKSFSDLDKTDPNDAFVIADFARVGRITSKPWRGTQHLALQRLTRHRLHIIESMTREKVYMVSNIYLKFSELAILDKKERPFSNTYGATASAVLTEYMSLDDITYAPIEELVEFISKKGKNRFLDPLMTAKVLQKAARDSYRLDETLYEPINASLSSSFNIIDAYAKELKLIDKAIAKAIKGLNTNEYHSLLSIPGIGPVFAGGILAEIGSISMFSSQDALAKYAGLTWRVKQSGKYTSEDTYMTKTGNKYLRYYLIEAANSVKNHVPEYNTFYQKKFSEVPKHQHKRALALTSRKLVRLIFGLLIKNQLFSNNKSGEKQNE